MAEEHGFETPEGHSLCANNCGFFGSPTTHNLCSKCYRDLRHKATASAAAEKPIAIAISAAAPAAPPFAGPRDPAVSAAAAERSCSSKAAQCWSCRRRVRLAGFACRCGNTFCGAHRYPEEHGCVFDFKAAGRAEIARANPVVKAKKLDAI